MTLAHTARTYVTPVGAGIASLRGNFMRRARHDGSTLAPLRAALLPDSYSNPAIEQIRSIAHSLAGAGGIFGYPSISTGADRLARTADAALQGSAAPRDIMRALDDLLRQIEGD
jgi:chemotaxis protein histidine kinase CheA